MKVLRFGVALLAAGRLLANYQFYYTDNLTSINPATWTQNGNPLPQGYGATLISTVASPTGSDYDIRMTVPQAGCAAYATLYARSTPNASTSYSVEFASSGITLSKTLAGSSTTLLYLPPYCAAGMVGTDHALADRRSKSKPFYQRKTKTMKIEAL